MKDETEVHEPFHRSDEGKISGTAYDTVWVARAIHDNGKSVFPECIQWLLENQYEDGSWGSTMLNYHDRVLSTLSAVTALKQIDGKRYNTCIEKGDYYRTFHSELDPSVSANIHVLDFVRNCPEFPDRDEIIERLIRFLKRTYRGFWIDKWHVSPYYPTSHAIFALCDVELSLTEKAVSWIADTQYENGMWGENGGTLEETAYAVQALLYYHQEVDHINMDSISKAFSYLGHDILPLLNTLPELWVGKVLYCPTNIVLSTILSASTMHITTVWNLCSGWST